jgi:hypothetical protein
VTVMMDGMKEIMNLLKVIVIMIMMTMMNGIVMMTGIMKNVKMVTMNTGTISV